MKASIIKSLSFFILALSLGGVDILASGEFPEIQSASQEETYTCIYGCEDAHFASWQKLMSHNFKTHKGKNRYVCHCGKSYKKSGLLVKHLDTHEGVYAYSCQYSCGYGSMYRSSVAEHEKVCSNRSSDAPKVYKHSCQYGCGYSAVQKSNAARHQKICKNNPSRLTGEKRKVREWEPIVEQSQYDHEEDSDTENDTEDEVDMDI